MKGKIKIGAGIFQDHHFGKWPQCIPPRSAYTSDEYKHEAADPDIVFDIEWTGNHWECTADGYGILSKDGGEYGNGSIFVSKRDGIEIIAPDLPKQ